MKRPYSSTFRGGGGSGPPGSGFPASFFRPSSSSSGSRQDETEVPLDSAAVKDLLEIFNRPAVRAARNAVLSMALPGPFYFSIPKLGIVNNEEMRQLIDLYWMGWARALWDGCRIFGVCPYYFVKRGDHQIPEVPDFTLGTMSVVTNNKTREVSYKWYDNSQSNPMRDAAKDMHWAITEFAPTSDGTIRSACACLLPDFRSLIKIRQARDVVVTQRSHPPHIIEMVPDPKAGQDDDLKFMHADYGKAAGIGAARLEESRQAETRQRTAALKKALRATQAANLQAATVQRTVWTDTPEAVLDEMDAGFGNRVVVLREHMRYRESAKPDLVADYEKASKEFDSLAAALMDSNVEYFTPSGGFNTRAHQGQLITRFTNARIREQSQFLQRHIRSAIIYAYHSQFRDVMDKAYQWRTRGKDAEHVSMLYPELDVHVHMPTSSTVTYEELEAMRADGIITQETMTRYVAQDKNMPLDDFVTLKYPDNVPIELVVPPPGVGKKPSKKKAAPSSVYSSTSQ
jgi:hypothetical protein